MKISNNGLAIVQAFEGCLKSVGGGKFKPYVCPAGVLTIGWGHTNHHGRQFKAGDIWTQAECDAQLVEDMKGFEAAVTRRVKTPILQHQFDALVSFTYNCGEGNLLKSTLLKKVNAGDFAGAAAEFHKWTRGGGQMLPGLVRRRKAEALLFQGKTREALVTAGVSRVPGPMPQGVDTPTVPKAPATRKTATGTIAVGGGVGGAVAATKSGLDLGDIVFILLFAGVVAGVVWHLWPKKEG